MYRTLWTGGHSRALQPVRMTKYLGHWQSYFFIQSSFYCFFLHCADGNVCVTMRQSTLLGCKIRCFFPHILLPLLILTEVKCDNSALMCLLGCVGQFLLWVPGVFAHFSGRGSPPFHLAHWALSPTYIAFYFHPQKGRRILCSAV